MQFIQNIFFGETTSQVVVNKSVDTLLPSHVTHAYRPPLSIWIVWK